jgi:hypothetical protein
MKLGAWLAGWVILMSGAVGADDQLAIRVSPSVAFAPANLNVRATIAADPANRSIEIIAESPEFYRSSAIELDGEAAPKTTLFLFRSLPTGEYSVRAVLRGQGGRELASVERKVNIVESGAGAR